MTNSNTSKAIRMAMAEKGIKGKDLAALIGVTPVTVSRWRDTGCDSVGDLTAIAKHCDMTFNELMALVD